jgi:hypothetical protein
VDLAANRCDKVRKAEGATSRVRYSSGHSEFSSPIPGPQAMMTSFEPREGTCVEYLRSHFPTAAVLIGVFSV